MIIISCPNCNKPIEATHAYKLEKGKPVAHVDCEKPVALSSGGRGITFASSKEDGSRTPGRGRND